VSAGCHGGDREPSAEAAAVVESFLSALEDEDYAKACGLLSPKGMQLYEGSHDQCVLGYETTAGPLWDFRIERVTMRSPSAAEVFVRVANDSESGRRGNRRYTFPVSRHGERWLLDSD
jgi:hypothetical protein